MMIFVLWVLGLIVIAIGWGLLDGVTGHVKSCAQSLWTTERSTRVQILVASVLGVAVLYMVVASADNMAVLVSLPSFVVWAGGLWLIPFQFHVADYYWLVYLALALILGRFLVWGTTSPSTRTQLHRDASTQQGPDSSTSMDGLGFLFWISLIGLTAAIVRYTATGNIGALHS